MATEKKGKKWTKFKWFLFFIILIAAVVAVFYFFVRIYHVDSGYIGVKSSINNPIDETDAYHVKTVNGYVVYVPLLTNLKIYPTSVIAYDLGQVKIHSQDGVEFIASPKVSLQLEASKAGDYSKNFKENIDNNPYLREAIINSFVTATSLYSTDSLIHNKAAYEKQLFDILSSKLDKEYFISLKNINTNLQYPQEVKDKIDLNAKVKQDILVAETQAKLTFIEADSKRKKDSLEYTNLTKLSIQKLFIDKWDGRLAPNPEQPIMYRDINRDDNSNLNSNTNSNLNTNIQPVNQAIPKTIVKQNTTLKSDSISQ